MIRSGSTDLPLHGGTVPPWLAERMARLGGLIIRCVAEDYGTSGVLQRLSDPMWFQSLGCVLGMDWHSSGITTSVMGALKKALNPMAGELGILVCGGRGKHGRNTPFELLSAAERYGLDAAHLTRSSRLAARVDNNAIQDGFQIYLHTFILCRDGTWSVVQQGMNRETAYARRYHWHSPAIRSFVEEPHTFIYGENRGTIINLTDRQADHAREGILNLASENPDKIVREAAHIVMPRRHHVTSADVDLKRLGAVLALAYDRQPADFESLLLLEGLGPRTLQSLALVAEVIHGAPCRFTDPARFSFAHGGKDGHPFPVPTRIYDETISVLEKAIRRARLDSSENKQVLARLALVSHNIEKELHPVAHFDPMVRKEWLESSSNGGRMAGDGIRHGKSSKYKCSEDIQMTLFEK